MVQNYVNSCTSKRPVSHKPCKTLVNMTHWFYLCIKQPTCTYSYTSSHEFLCYVFLSSAFSSLLSPSTVKFHDTVLQCNTSETLMCRTQSDQSPRTVKFPDSSRHSYPSCSYHVIHVFSSITDMPA